LHPVPRYRFTVDLMTAETTPELGWAPAACTLPTAEQPARVARFDALFAAADRIDRLGPTRLRVALTGGNDALDAVRDLTDRESRCCSFFTFTLTAPGPESFVLDVEVPQAHVDVLDTLAARSIR
jgi:hypothetical protein